MRCCLYNAYSIYSRMVVGVSPTPKLSPIHESLPQLMATWLPHLRKEVDCQRGALFMLKVGLQSEGNGIEH